MCYEQIAGENQNLSRDCAVIHVDLQNSIFCEKCSFLKFIDTCAEHEEDDFKHSTRTQTA